jgi:hypothetical protein
MLPSANASGSPLAGGGDYNGFSLWGDLLGCEAVVHEHTFSSHLLPHLLRALGIRIALSWAQWYLSIVLILRRLRREDSKFQASLDYKAKCCLKKRKRAEHRWPSLEAKPGQIVCKTLSCKNKQINK